MREFWDNSPEHWEDIKLFMGGRKEASLFYQMIIDLWTEDYQRVVLRIHQHLCKETL